LASASSPSLLFITRRRGGDIGQVDPDRDRDRDHVRGHDRDRDRDHDPDPDRDRDLDHVRDHVRDHDHDHGHDPDSDPDSDPDRALLKPVRNSTAFIFAPEGLHKFVLHQSPLLDRQLLDHRGKVLPH
jgi:hypothetical protein